MKSAPSRLQFSSEQQVQDYCLSVLRSKGIAARSEVWCGNVRADIVTDRAVMELKKVLDREAIYQAYGQAMTYQKFLHKPEVWIVGQTPIHPSERATAFTVAREISAHNVKVSFIESDSFWRMRSIPISTRFNFFNRFSLSSQSVVILLVISIAFLASTFGNSQMRSSPNEASHSASSVAAVPVSVAPSPSVAISFPSPASRFPAVRLQVCNGGSVANFRRSPSLNAPVLGVLQAGDAVQLTGRIAQADGVDWVEAIPPHAAHQVGWIAACFVGE